MFHVPGLASEVFLSSQAGSPVDFLVLYSRQRMAHRSLGNVAPQLWLLFWPAYLTLVL